MGQKNLLIIFVYNVRLDVKPIWNLLSKCKKTVKKVH